MTKNEYNGWFNYETWNAKLWMDNDGSDERWNERAQELIKEHGADEATGPLSRELKDDFEELAPDLGASCFSDLLTAAMSEINWDEIASHIIDDNKGEVEEETKEETED